MNNLHKNNKKHQFSETNTKKSPNKSQIFQKQRITFNIYIPNWDSTVQFYQNENNEFINCLQILEKNISKNDEERTKTYMFPINNDGNVQGEITLFRNEIKYQARFEIPSILQYYITINHFHFEGILQHLESEGKVLLSQVNISGEHNNDGLKLVLLNKNYQESENEELNRNIVCNINDDYDIKQSESDLFNADTTETHNKETEFDEYDINEGKAERNCPVHNISHSNSISSSSNNIRCHFEKIIDEMLSLGSEYSSDFSDISSDFNQNSDYQELSSIGSDEEYFHLENHEKGCIKLQESNEKWRDSTIIVSLNCNESQSLTYDKLEVFHRRENINEENNENDDCEKNIIPNKKYHLKKHWKVKCYVENNQKYIIKEVYELINEGILQNLEEECLTIR